MGSARFWEGGHEALGPGLVGSCREGHQWSCFFLVATHHNTTEPFGRRGPELTETASPFLMDGLKPLTLNLCQIVPSIEQQFPNGPRATHATEMARTF